jgi:murein DD-endopeptidase MepM/ murein hydrolase activator NlpD
MRRRSVFTKISIVVTLATAFFINSAVILAETQQVDGSQSGETSLLQPDSGSQTSADASGVQTYSGDSQQGADSQQVDEQALKRLKFLDSIREEMRTTQRNFLDIGKNISDAGTKLEAVQEVAKTLTEELNNLDAQIAQTTSLLENVTMQIGQTENELVLLYEDMDAKKAAIENQKMMLTEYLKTLYEQESGISDTTTGNSEVNIAKLLLSNQTAGEQLQEIRYFSILESTGHDIYDKLEKLLTDLELDEKMLQEKKDKLSALNVQLTEEKKNLDAQKDAKQHLLDQTKGDEKIYQQLIEESRVQQQQQEDDLSTLRSNLQFIQNKIAELGDNFNPDDYTSLFSHEKFSIYDYISQSKDDPSGFNPMWPVSPSRGISAYFHDPSYRAVFGVNHEAIDIRTSQGTIIRAPADGIVYKVRDNGYGYSYLIIAHTGGFMTVYGHVSAFLVSEGDKVLVGQAVALSGGTPGSRGAGLMTTGAHLHFEVMQGGKHVDPLDYLPLTFLSLDSLPDKYKTRITGDKPKVRRIDPDQYSTDTSLTQAIERNALIESTVLQQQQ